MTARSLLLAALTFAALALAACGGDDTGSATDAAPIDQGTGVDAAPRQVIMETVSLVPGELAEGIMTGGPSDYAVIHLEAPVAELDWNIHGHAGGGTQTVYEELNQLTVDYVFRPSAETDWWLLIRNSGPAAMDVVVRVELYEDLQWRWE
jgi:hypothetical protein